MEGWVRQRKFRNFAPHPHPSRVHKYTTTYSVASSTTTMKLFLPLSLLLVLGAVRTVVAQQNVYQVARSMPETFSTLVRAVVNAGLVDALSDPALGSTVFAPTNDAFVALNALNLPSANTLNLFRDPDWTPHLQDLLLYHILGGSQVLAEDVTDGLTVTMLNGEDVTFSVSEEGAVSLNSAATVVAADVSASNGKVVLFCDET
jgi:uncharacterized surface protein with fasciclin (FAS1) repeats